MHLQERESLRNLQKKKTPTEEACGPKDNIPSLKYTHGEISVAEENIEAQLSSAQNTLSLPKTLPTLPLFNIYLK